MNVPFQEIRIEKADHILKKNKIEMCRSFGTLVSLFEAFI